jgi:hypothetical protein
MRATTATPSPRPSSATSLPPLSSECKKRNSYKPTRKPPYKHPATPQSRKHPTNTSSSHRGPIGAAFGVSAGIFALFFFDGIPRVQTDILQKVPFIGDFYHKEVAPEDNPF